MKICRVCNKNNIKTVIDLGSTPLEDDFLKKKEINKKQIRIKLSKEYCNYCGYFGLSLLTSPKSNSEKFLYLSKTTAGLIEHFDDYAKSISKYISKNEFLLDLGSNDGSFLNSVKKIGRKAIGIEPAIKIAKYANKKKLTTIIDFFNKRSSKKIVRNYGYPKVITANYMYANVANLNIFTKNVSNLLENNGYFIVQTGYHPEQMKINMFDYIYHEHFSYFTLRCLSYLFQKNGLKIFDAVITKPKGGSIRVFAKKTNKQITKSKRLIKISNEEVKNGIFLISTYKKYVSDLNLIKQDIHKKLNYLKIKGYEIIGFGASHSTTTLIYYFDLHNFIKLILDDNPIKHNRYSPGRKIPVYPSKYIKKSKIKLAIIILAWQHQNTILNKHFNSIKNDDLFVIPLPKLKIAKK